MPRTLRRISHENFFVVGRCVPENFGDIPWPVSIMDEQAIPIRFQLAIRADHGLGGRALHEGARFRIENRAEKVIGCGITDFQSNRRIKFG